MTHEPHTALDQIKAILNAYERDQSDPSPEGRMSASWVLRQIAEVVTVRVTPSGLIRVGKVEKVAKGSEHAR